MNDELTDAELEEVSNLATGDWDGDVECPAPLLRKMAAEVRRLRTQVTGHTREPAETPRSAGQK
jgi:hypothetical protein